MSLRGTAPAAVVGELAALFAARGVRRVGRVGRGSAGVVPRVRPEVGAEHRVRGQRRGPVVEEPEHHPGEVGKAALDLRFATLCAAQYTVFSNQILAILIIITRVITSL